MELTLSVPFLGVGKEVTTRSLNSVRTSSVRVRSVSRVGVHSAIVSLRTKRRDGSTRFWRITQAQRREEGVGESRRSGKDVGWSHLHLALKRVLYLLNFQDIFVIPFFLEAKSETAVQKKRRLLSTIQNKKREVNNPVTSFT